MKTFFSTVGKSIYGPLMYGEIASKPFSFSLKYYVKFALLVSLVVTVVLAVQAVPFITAALGDFAGELAERYPADLEVRIRQGQVSINQPEPYFIALPSPEERNGATYRNLLVIDTTRPFDQETFRNYGTVLWITKDSVVAQGSGRIQIIPLDSVPDVTINRDAVRGLGSKINPIARVLPFVLIPLIFIGGLFYFAFQMLYLLIGALLIWLLLAIMKRKVGYGTAYQVGLHAMTVGILISALDLIIGANLHIIPLQFTVLMLVVTGISFAGGAKPTVNETGQPA